MNPFYRSIFVFLALCALVSAQQSSVSNALDSLIIPSIDLKQTPFREVVDQLNGYLQKEQLPQITVDVSKPQISIGTNALPFADVAGRLIKNYTENLLSQTNLLPPIMFTAQRISMSETLNIISSMAGFDLSISDTSIVMRLGPANLSCEAFCVWPVSDDLPFWIETSAAQPWAQIIVPNTNVVLLIDSPERLRLLRESHSMKMFQSDAGHDNKVQPAK